MEYAVRTLLNGDLEHAEKICLQVMKVAPRHAEGFFLLGLIEARKGHLSVAESMFSTALDIDHNHRNAKQHIDKIHQARREARTHSYVKEYQYYRSAHMDFPRNIGIETAGFCNAKCTFCPHGTLDRKRQVMSDVIFNRILQGLKEIPTHIPCTIFPNLVNEPFMDKHILSRLESIHESAPHMGIIIFTNFNVIPKGFFDRIWDIKGIREINVSLNSANETEYRHIMGIDFQRTANHIRRFLRENRKRHFLQGPMRLSRVRDHSHRDEAFIVECRSLFADFEYGIDYQPHIKNRTNWIGNINADQSPVPSLLPCGGWFDINIFCNGTVPHCCMDSMGEYAIGDMSTNTLLEIYNSSKFRNYRESMISRETAYPCNICSLLQ